MLNPGSKCQGWAKASAALRGSIVLRDLQLNLCFGKRGEEMRRAWDRYINIYCLIDGDKIPLRVLQLAGMDICLKYLRGGLPVFFHLPEGKQRAEEGGFTVCRTLQPDELSLFDPIVGTLLHYQMFDLVRDQLFTRAVVAPTEDCPYPPPPPGINKNDKDTGTYWPDYEYPMGCVGLQGWQKTRFFDNGVSKDPILRQLYVHPTDVRLSQSPYGTRYANQGTCSMLGCTPFAIAHVAGHNDPESQASYAANRLRAEAVLPDGTKGFIRGGGMCSIVLVAMALHYNVCTAHYIC